MGSGFGCIIIAGVTISRGTIVAAGDVVTHDVPPMRLLAAYRPSSSGRVSQVLTTEQFTMLCFLSDRGRGTMRHRLKCRSDRGRRRRL